MKGMIFNGITVRKTAKHQMPLAQKRGGLGVRDPEKYQYAARISSLKNKKEVISKHFLCHPNNNG